MNDIQRINTFLRSVKGESLPYRQIFDDLNTVFPFTEAVVVSSLPRGGLHVVQPPRLPEILTRAYRNLHAHDSLTWQAIAKGRPVQEADAWANEGHESTRYLNEFMHGNGLFHAAAAPLSGPVFEGYPGAVHLYRNASQGALGADEQDRLGEFAQELDAAILRARNSRKTDDCVERTLPNRPQVRMFILDSQLQSPLPQADPSVLDERLRENMLTHARRQFEHVNGEDTADRISLADGRGDLWNFRVVLHRSYPSLSDGPVLFFCLQPSCGEWGLLRPADFSADPELARLLPALKFMREQFHRGPTLVEIAKTVHLSPFHFHRRFTELLGITPKHFLLDCQIDQAKNELLAREKELVKIATECGFAHQSHFTSRFKQATGLTPTRWRRMAAETIRTSSN